MEDMRINRLEVQFDEFASATRSGFRDVDTRLCKIESRLEQSATKAALSEVEATLKAALSAIEARLEQSATKADLIAIEARLEQSATKADLIAIEARLDQTATKADMQDSRIEMYKNNADMKTWLLATMITIIALFCVALFGLQHWNG